MISHRRVQKESDESLYTRLGHSLWSAISCQRKRSIPPKFSFLPQIIFARSSKFEIPLFLTFHSNEHRINLHFQSLVKVSSYYLLRNKFRARPTTNQSVSSLRVRRDEKTEAGTGKGKKIVEIPRDS